MISISVSAYDFEVGGLCYNYNDGVNGTSVSVTYKSLTPNTYGGNVVIPAKVTYNNHTYHSYINAIYTIYNCAAVLTVMKELEEKSMLLHRKCSREH